MTDAKSPKPARLSPWLRLVFGLSLALNLAVVGLVVGVALRDKPHKHKRPLPTIGTMMYRELDKDQRHALRVAVMGSRKERDQRRAQDVADLTRALRQVPFQPETMNAVLDQQVRYMDAFQLAVRAAWLEQVARMSDTDRAAYAERLSAAMLKPRPPKPD